MPARKKPGGRFSGIAPRGNTNEPVLKAGEYILEFIETSENRRKSCLLLDVMVIYAEGEGCSKPEEGKLRGFINYGDIANQTFVSLAMALCGCATVEQLEVDEPDFDELIDAICCKDSAERFTKPGATEPAFGKNPIAGMRVYARVWDSETIAKRGEPYRNFEFGVCPDEWKKAEAA